MTSNIAVIGAGMVGVSIACHLQKNGFQVTLIDRKQAGEETSYGNAGLIQREAIFPYPMPRSLPQILQILPNRNLDIRYNPKAMWHYRHALWQYFVHSHPKHFEAICQEWASLIVHATDAHETLLQDASCEHLVRKVGWLQLHRQFDSFNHAQEHVRAGQNWGVEAKVLTPSDIAQLEPDLNVKDFIGGIHWQNAWQVTNPGALVKAYAAYFESLGGVVSQHDVQSLYHHQNAWHIHTNTQRLQCDQVVVAAGPWSQKLLQALGYQFPLFPMRGYHKHFVLPQDKTLHHSIVDEDYGFVMGPKAAGIRLTTGAEFTFMDSPSQEAQLNGVLEVARQLLPLQEAVEEQAWFGHRPCLPDMKPIIGPAPRHCHLWLAFGHAHQGFTLGPITGVLLSQMILGQKPLLDVSPFSAQRFLDKQNRF